MNAREYRSGRASTTASDFAEPKPLGFSARWPGLASATSGHVRSSAVRRRARALRDLVAWDAGAVVDTPPRELTRQFPVPEPIGAIERGRQHPDVARHYRFLDTDETGQPVTWPAAAPIEVFVDQRLAPANFAEQVLQVLSELTHFTSIPFRVAGVGTLRVADFERGIADGHANAPRVLVTFVATTAELDSADPAVANCKTWTTRDPMGTKRRNAGLIRFSAEARLPSRFVPNGWGAVLRHEAGHLVGLGHVEDPQQVMSINGRQVADWGLGDRTGLRLIGHAARGLDITDAA